MLHLFQKPMIHIIWKSHFLGQCGCRGQRNPLLNKSFRYMNCFMSLVPQKLENIYLNSFSCLSLLLNGFLFCENTALIRKTGLVVPSSCTDSNPYISVKHDLTEQEFLKYPKIRIYFSMIL